MGSKITADDDCSLEIRRSLLLGRKVMTNLESVLKSKDITVLKKVRIVKAMFFPIVMYRYERWTIGRQSTKDMMLSNHGTREDSRESLGQ